jgi:hypothetical protein
MEATMGRGDSYVPYAERGQLWQRLSGELLGLPRDRLPPVATFGVYLDESHQKGCRVTAIAGYIANLDVWGRNFEPRWRSDVLDTFQLEEFSAGDEFNIDYKDEAASKRREAIFTAAVDVVAKPIEGLDMRGFGAAVVFPPHSEMPAFVKKKNLEHEGYRFAFYDLMLNVVEWAARSLPQGSSVEFYPDRKVKCTQHMYGGFRNAYDEVKRKFPGVGMSIPEGDNDSKKIVPLQVADLFAFECAREAVRRLPDGRRDRPMRTSLKRLLAESPFLHECLLADIRAYALMQAGRIPSGRFPPPWLFQSGLYEDRLIWTGGEGTEWIVCGDGEPYKMRRTD